MTARSQTADLMLSMGEEKKGAQLAHKRQGLFVWAAMRA